MKSRFLDRISVLDKTDEVIVFFVFPQGNNFLSPDTGGEVKTDVWSIDCSTMDAVRASVKRLASKVAN
jgi:hypothetical protein